jgi:hypothetical protein
MEISRVVITIITILVDQEKSVNRGLVQILQIVSPNSKRFSGFAYFTQVTEKCG